MAAVPEKRAFSLDNKNPSKKNKQQEKENKPTRLNKKSSL